MTNRPAFTRRAFTAITVCALIVSACGGDDDDDTTSATSPATSPATEAPAATTEAPAESAEASEEGGSGGASEDAAERVATFLQPMTELPLNEPVAMPTGKKLFYIKCGVPVCEEIGTGIDAAAAAVGWTVESTSHQDTPDTVASAWDTALAAQPDVVMTSGNPREWFADQLATFEEQGVPVITWSIAEGYEPGDGIDVNLLTNDDYHFYGMLMADYSAVNSANQDILFVGLPTFPVLSTVQQGFTEEIATACPDCTVKTMEVAVTDLGTNLPGMVVSELQTNPDLDMVVYAFGGMLFGVPEAIEAAGLGDQAAAISQAGGPLNFGYITAGQHQVAEVAIASEMLGWRAIDAAARLLAGEGPGRATTPAQAVVDGHPDILAGGMPLQILEAGTITDPASLWSGVDDFEAKYKAVWGI
jgi:ribose transport system substrate-binding protein